MREKVVVFLISMLFIANTSTVLGISKEKDNTNGEGMYCIFEDSSGKREIKYIEIDENAENVIDIFSLFCSW